jgi:type I restriction enzyme S subunit
MSELPPGWERTSLGDLVTVSYGKGLSARDRDGSGVVPVVGSAGVAGTHSVSLVDEPVIVIGRKGNAGSVWSMSGPSWPIDTTYFIRVPGAIDQSFLSSQLDFLRLGQLDSSTAIPSLRRQDLEGAAVVVPPRAEQERIVAAIEEHLARLDAAEAATSSGRRRLAGFYDAVLQSAFDPGWPREMLDSLNNPERPICYGILKPKTPEPGTVPYVEVRSIAKGQIKVTELHKTTMSLHEEFRRSALRPGDVTLAIRGSFDRAAVVPQELVGANVSRDVARIAPNPQLLAQFLAAFLVSPEARRFFRAHARGVAVQGNQHRRSEAPAGPDPERRDSAARDPAG